MHSIDVGHSRDLNPGLQRADGLEQPPSRYNYFISHLVNTCNKRKNSLLQQGVVISAFYVAIKQESRFFMGQGHKICMSLSKLSRKLS